MKRIALGLVLALSLSAGAAVKHEDGSQTITVEEQQSIMDFVAKLNKIIEFQQALQDEQKRRIEALEARLKAKCL